MIDLNFSLDGLANTHDAIRGVPNNFQKTLATMDMAAKKWRGVRRLRRNVVSCVTAENYRELVELGLKMMRESESDGHYFEIIRGDPMDATLKRLAAGRTGRTPSKIALVSRALCRAPVRTLTGGGARAGPGVLPGKHKVSLRHS